MCTVTSTYKDYSHSYILALGIQLHLFKIISVCSPNYRLRYFCDWNNNNIRWLKLYSHSRIDDGLYLSANDTGNRIYEKHIYVHTITQTCTVKISITVTLKMCSLSYMMGEICFATKRSTTPTIETATSPHRWECWETIRPDRCAANNYNYKCHQSYAFLSLSVLKWYHPCQPGLFR